MVTKPANIKANPGLNRLNTCGVMKEKEMPILPKAKETSNLANPVRIGVPAAPKTTEAPLPKSAITKALITGRPRPTRSGVTTATGVPNPAVHSMKFSKNQANMIICIR